MSMLKENIKENKHEPLSAQALDLLKDKAKKGDSKAQCELGDYFVSQKNSDEALAWYEQSANQGNSKAQYSAAKHYLGIQRSAGGALRLALKWVEELKDKGDSRAEELWEACSRAENFKSVYLKYQSEKIFNTYLQAAEKGDAKAQYNLAECYLRGTDPDQRRDYIKALKWFKKSAKQGNSKANAKAFYIIGLCCEGLFTPSYERDNLLIKIDKKRAVQYYKGSANGGCPEARWSLGRCYEKGIGVTADDKAAIECYQLALQEGYVAAPHEMEAFQKLITALKEDEKTAVSLLITVSERNGSPLHSSSSSSNSMSIPLSFPKTSLSTSSTTFEAEASSSEQSNSPR